MSPEVDVRGTQEYTRSTTEAGVSQAAVKRTRRPTDEAPILAKGGRRRHLRSQADRGINKTGKPYYGENRRPSQRHLHVAATCKGDQLTRYDPGGRDGARETCKGLSRKKAKATKAAGGRAGRKGKRTGDRARAREQAAEAKQVQERAGGKKNGRTRGDAGGQPGHDLGTRIAHRRRSVRQQRFGKIKVADRRSKQGDNHVGDRRGTRSRKIVGLCSPSGPTENIIPPEPSPTASRRDCLPRPGRRPGARPARGLATSPVEPPSRRRPRDRRFLSQTLRNTTNT